MKFRLYDPAKDKQATYRMFREVGWIQKDQQQECALDEFLESCRVHVAEVHGETECLVATTPGDLQYLEEHVPMASVAAVTTSHVARKQGLAGRVSARAIADDATDGAAVSMLGMFEHGFYNRLGFGTGSYLHQFSFDPSQVKVDVKARVPRRLTIEDGELVHAARMARARGHGSINLHRSGTTSAEMKWHKKGFDMGYCDGPNGELTHLVRFIEEGERGRGPYVVYWMVYQTSQQFKELMALIRSLGDQVRKIIMFEPPGIQFQDLLVQPFRWRQITQRSPFESNARATAFWQIRMNDLFACLNATRLRGESVQFNLRLSDPISAYLDPDASWRGIAGDYIITLGPASSAEAGQNPNLPTLHASVGAFSRLWIGVQPATGLAITDDLSGPAELLEQLDWAFRLPIPHPNWEI